MNSPAVLIKVSAVIVLYCFFMAKSVAMDEPLEALFFDLKNSSNPIEARKFEHQIWQSWFQSGNDEIDQMLKKAMERRRWYDFNGAVDILSQIIKKKPDYAEAWNQRATVYFHQQNFEQSLIDIAKALELEPRHFGAMAGRAMIRLQQNRPALAMQNIIQAIKIHPFLKERSMFPGFDANELDTGFIDFQHKHNLPPPEMVEVPKCTSPGMGAGRVTQEQLPRRLYLSLTTR